MVKIDLAAMNEMWKRIILRNKMAIETAMCSPRGTPQGPEGYFAAKMLVPGITDQYGVKLSECRGCYSLQVVYFLEKGSLQDLVLVMIPQTSFEKFAFTLTNEYTISCQVVGDYSKGTNPLEQERDAFTFWLSHFGEEVLVGIEETVRAYEKKYPYVKWVSEAQSFGEPE